LRKKNQILGLIKEVAARNRRQAVSVIRPVPTRWTAYFLAYRRLLELRVILELIVAEDAAKALEHRQVIIGDRDAQSTARKMVECIKDGFFWNSLARFA